jgi:hypothetical protein
MNGCWQIAGWEIELSYQDYSHNVGIEDPCCSMPLDLCLFSRFSRCWHWVRGSLPGQKSQRLFAGAMAVTRQGTTHPKVHPHSFNIMTPCSLSVDISLG